MKNLLYLFALCLLVSCNNTATEVAESDPVTTQTTEPAPDRSGEVFGAEENFSNPVGMLDVVDKLGQNDTLTNVALHGEVTAVCQAKGCWMTIAGEEEMMVKFKDYGFFMPKDIDGREVVMFGKAYYQITPLDELRHYAEDAGKSAEEIAAITEPKKELRFLASGVKLLPETVDQQN